MSSEGKWVQLEITLLTKGLKVMIPSYFDGQAPVINMHKNVHSAFSKLELTGKNYGTFVYEGSSHKEAILSPGLSGNWGESHRSRLLILRIDQATVAQG